MARQKTLDDRKKTEICAMLTAGMSLRKAARHVGCDRRTIHRERQIDPEFGERVRRARMMVDLSPHEAMRRFAATHWRAAAWMLDRQERREAARRAEKYFTPTDLENLAEGVQHILRRSLVIDPWDAPTVAEQVGDLFRQAEPGKTKPPARDARRSGPTLAESLRFLQKRWSERATTDDERPEDAAPADAPGAFAPPSEPQCPHTGALFSARDAARSAENPSKTESNGRVRGEE